MKTTITLCPALYVAGCCLLPSLTFAGPEDTLKFQVGASFQTINSDAQVGGKNRNNTASIDLEDDLDLDDKVDIAGFNFEWRFADNHRIGLDYLPLKRTANNRIDGDIEFEDDVIHAGAQVSSEFDSTIYDVNYIYSVFKTSNMELGLSAGLHWVSFDFNLQASGYIEDENGNNEFNANYYNEAEANAPLPVFGVAFNYMITPQWEFYTSARYLELEIGDYTGKIISAKVATDYYFNDYVGIGMSAGFFDLDVEADTNDFQGSFGWKYSGLQANLSLRY